MSVLFKPKTKLIRLGKSNDGGYCIPEKSLDEANILFSFGLDDNWSFEEHFKKKSGADGRQKYRAGALNANGGPPEAFGARLL